jgi:hypothetical protein
MQYLSTNIIWMACLLAATTLAIGRSLIPRWRKRTSILDLPPELLDLIFPCLTPITQACLALSCKKFYNQFGSVLKTLPIQFPYSSGLDGSFDRDLRYRFLLKLESKRWPWPYFRSRRWTYCAACLKLHPMTEFNTEHYHYDDIQDSASADGQGSLSFVHISNSVRRR